MLSKQQKPKLRLINFNLNMNLFVNRIPKKKKIKKKIV